LPIREYCRKHNVDEGQFYRWRRILKLEAGKRKRQAPEPGFVLVRAAGEARLETGAGALELVLDRGWRLRIASGVEEALLRTVLKALAAGA
jgi:transposase-like protein